jgi:hypothetical protein
MKPGAVLFVFLLVAVSLSFLFLTISPFSAVDGSTVHASLKREASTMSNGGTTSSGATFTPIAQHSNSQLGAPKSQLSLAAKTSLPSPFLVAACIVGLVALFGGLLSLFWGRHRGKQVSGGSVVIERFWAIDGCGVR